jgi:hypothetical protein
MTRTEMLDDALKLLDEQMAHFAGLSGPERAVESEHWFRREIAKALAPILTCIEAMEKKPAPPATAFKPSPQWEKTMLQMVGKFVASEIDKRALARIEMLERKLDALETKQGQFRYCGVWSADAIYFQGNFVTHHGSLWHANRETTQRPGDGGSDWQLCVKRGKDGKDLHVAAAPRQPTQARTYGH